MVSPEDQGFDVEDSTSIDGLRKGVRGFHKLGNTKKGWEVAGGRYVL